MESGTTSRIRVECCPYDPDEKNPIRLVIVDNDDTVVTELSFTPERAWDSAYSVSRLVSHLAPRADTHRIARGLRNAAIRVWAIRN